MITAELIPNVLGVILYLPTNLTIENHYSRYDYTKPYCLPHHTFSPSTSSCINEYFRNIFLLYNYTRANHAQPLLNPPHHIKDHLYKCMCYQTRLPTSHRAIPKVQAVPNLASSHCKIVTKIYYICLRLRDKTHYLFYLK